MTETKIQELMEKAFRIAKEIVIRKGIHSSWMGENMAISILTVKIYDELKSEKARSIKAKQLIRD